jgi:single-strand DNA-binding protein
MNVWNFIGNVGRDAEVRYTPAGDAITNFSVAVKAGYGDKAVTTWANCSIFGKRGEAVAKHILKGNQIGVSGEVLMREWDKDGTTQKSLECRVNDVTLLGKKDDAKTQAPSLPNEPEPEIPF